MEIKRILTTAACVLGAYTAIFADSSDSLLPVLEEGKSWLVIYYNPRITPEECDKVIISVVGDDEIDGIACKKIEFNYSNRETTYGYAREEDGVVYEYTQGPEEDDYEYGFYPMMELGLNPEDVWDELKIFNYGIEDIDYISVDDVVRRRMTLSKTNEEYWVEGIGFSTTRASLIDKPVTSVSRVGYLVACYKDGQCIFRRSDFERKGSAKPAPEK